MAAPARHAVDEKTTHSWQEKSTSGTGETYIRWVKGLRAMDPTMGMMALSRLVVPRRRWMGSLWVHIRLTCALPVERLAPVVGAREMEPRRLRPSWPDHDPAPGAGGRDSSVADGPSSVEPSPHRITIWKGLSVALCRTSDKDRLLSTTLKAGSITQP
jgi:hypothetical protein